MPRKPKPVPPIACDACRAPAPSQAHDELRAQGWQQRAEKGPGSERWPWLCPACIPREDAKSLQRRTWSTPKSVTGDALLMRFDVDARKAIERAIENGWGVDKPIRVARAKRQRV